MHNDDSAAPSGVGPGGSDVIRGNSGAMLMRMGRDMVAKFSDDVRVASRVNAQARYMRQLGAPFVRVFGISDGWYMMEKLHRPLVTTPDDIERTLSKTIELAFATLWCRKASDRHPVQNHIGYVSDLCLRNGLDDTVSKNLMGRAVEMTTEFWPHLTMCRTHGDMALDNVMVDGTGALKFIDAIPPSAHMPGFLACDLGKLMQSASGYESWRYPGDGWAEPDTDKCRKIILEGVGHADSMASHYFLILSWLRMLRYTQGSVRDRVHAELVKELNRDLRI